jgi:hypothetical protein
MSIYVRQHGLLIFSASPWPNKKFAELVLHAILANVSSAVELAQVKFTLTS